MSGRTLLGVALEPEQLLKVINELVLHVPIVELKTYPNKPRSIARNKKKDCHA